MQLFIMFLFLFLGEQKSNGYHTSVPNNSFYNKSNAQDIWKAMSGTNIFLTITYSFSYPIVKR